MLRVGVTLPQFRHDPGPAVAVARRAEAAGVDGLFVFDHLWPLGRPDRPALHSTTLLGALAAETSRVAAGTLVARVGLLPDAVLVHTLATLHRLLGDRLIAGLGTGDRANRDENVAAGVAYPPAAERVAAAAWCAAALQEAGVRTWIGGLGPAVRRAAATAAGGWNGWGLDAASFARLAGGVREDAGAGGRPFEVTWGGQVLVGRSAAEAVAKLQRHGPRPGLVHGTVGDLAAFLRALAAAGASWAVCAPLDVGVDDEAVDLVAEAAALAR
jgi:alkanesulfonate monooxygenase SsuD/methylene tetrahydromethanopterin reductase-like flavin-dependent oxidoreductase (luciferase family)